MSATQCSHCGRYHKPGEDGSGTKGLVALLIFIAVMVYGCVKQDETQACRDRGGVVVWPLLECAAPMGRAPS